MMDLSSSISASRPVKLGLICAGGCGTNNAREVMSTIDPEAHPHLYILVGNTDRPQLENHFVVKEGEIEDPREACLQKWLRLKDEQFFILQLGESGMGAGGKPEEGARVAEKAVHEIKKFLEKVDTVILIAGGGKGTGSGALPIIAAAANDADKSPLAIFTMPRFSEGGRRLKKADEARKKLLEICPTAVIYNQQIPDTTLTYTDGWTKINQSCLLPMLLVLQEIILRVADLNIDLKDWRSMLEVGNYVQFGLCRVGNNQDFEAIADQLLNNPYQDSKIVNKALEVMLYLHGKTWTFAENDKVVSCIEARMERSIGSEDIQITPGVYQTVQDDEKWVALLAVAKEPPSDTVSEFVPTQKPVTLTQVANPEPVEVTSMPQTTIDNTGGNGHRTQLLQFYVSGELKNLQVREDLAQKWNRIFTMSSVKSADLVGLRTQIKSETGLLPDVPKGLPVVN